jgi:hypothetical protein
VELFQGDHVAGVHQSPGGLVVEVAAPVAHLAPFLGQGAAEPLAVPRAAARVFLAPLEVGDRLGRGGEELRVGDDLPVGGGQEPGYAQVSSHAAAGCWEGYGVSVSGNDYIPAAVFPLKLERFHRPGDWPVLAHFDRADGLERCPRPPVGRGGGPLRAVPCDETDLREPAVGLEPRIARLSLLRPRIKGGEHGVEPTQGLLLSGERMAPLAVRVGAADLA